MKIIEYVLGGIIAIITAINIQKWSKLNWKERVLLIGGIVFAIIVACNSINDYSENNFLKKINAVYGDIQDDQNSTTPVLAFGMTDPTAYLNLEPTGTFIVKLNDSVKSKDTVTFTLFKLYIKGNKLYITTIVYDSIGDLALAVYNNFWKLYNKNFEYNYDTNAIEIIESDTHSVLFHIDLKNGRAYVEGCMYTPKSIRKNHKKIIGIKIFSNPNNVGFKSLESTDEGIDSSVHPIFKYPREKYLGVRVHY